MKNGKSFLAIIPARSGSKGLPGKNIKELCGKPLIAWSIEVALDVEYIDEVIVSTDCEIIKEIAEKYGANVPFLRPRCLAEDRTSSFDVVKHALDYYKNELNKEFDYIVLLEPTSPLREVSDIKKPIELMLTAKAKAIVGICKTIDQNPAFLITKNSFGFIQGYKNSGMDVIRRQDIDDVYFFEGSVYISDVETLLFKKTFYHDQTVGYVFPKYKSLEIDDIDDFIMVEAIMKFKGYN